MGRWEPDAGGRLARAALELYAERGYEQTTVAEIAQRAGVTERTFFRHYADKREVLFGASDEMYEVLVSAVGAAPPAATPLRALTAGLVALAGIFVEQHEHARQRQAVIAANASLRERELTKLAAMATALADALRRRGVADPAATLAAEAGIATFKVGFELWLAGPEEADVTQVVREALDELGGVFARG
ncbi:TetR/AcrR family transcriptional regulator [Streptomyces buecherae]|uniref:TetR/AcrR family transcriptional regulator n=1 Tax=Streptomyces buecherae TaxID=2763006 RepID=UPI001C270237|nr:TetR/AcrR family transcriptional regulator [Streptomyces buecherae]